MKLLVIGTGVIVESELRAIEKDGFEATVVETVEAASACLSEGPAVAVMDLALAATPTGGRLFQALREPELDAHVIFVAESGEGSAPSSCGLEIVERPCDRGELGAALSRATERNLAGGARAVLLIEDHEPTLRRLLRILAKEGYEVEGAPDGEEGLRLIATGRFDVVVTDVKLPNKSGIDVVRETQAGSVEVAFIMTTGYGSEDIVLEALREGAVNVLRKPMDIDHLLLAVEKALEGQALRRSLADRERENAALRALVSKRS